ncbi:MAG: carbohydrate kinase family protein [Flavitalea sp.]
MVDKSGIVCVGILCADILGKTVDQLPEKGKLNLINSISLQIGGCAANAAISLSKIGINTSIIGKIGDDSLGKFLLNTLQHENVEVCGMVIDKELTTSSSIVMISSDGERSIIHSMGANEYFEFNDIAPQYIRQKKILLIAGTFLMPHFDGKGTEKLLKLAKEHGVICCMDTAWDSTGQWLQKIEYALQYLDWFMPSYDEANELSQKTEPEEMADFFISKGVKNVIIKLNIEGCFVKPENKAGYIVPSYNIIKPVDASGAGDSFCAGFIAGLYQDWEIEKCARFANAAGAHCIMKVGTTSGIKSMTEILAFMQMHDNAETRRAI